MTSSLHVEQIEVNRKKEILSSLKMDKLWDDATLDFTAWLEGYTKTYNYTDFKIYSLEMWGMMKLQFLKQGIDLLPCKALFIEEFKGN